MQLNSEQAGKQVIDIGAHSKFLELSASPIWVYDSVTCCNVWGNRAALELFGCDAANFNQQQMHDVKLWSSEQLRLWRMLNQQLHQDVEVEHKEVTITVSGYEPVPSFLPINRPKLLLKAIYKPLTTSLEGVENDVTLVQVLQQNYEDVEDNHMRVVEMCNNHPMFQFLFDENGKLLAANKRAMYNMREHLGSCENYNLKMYLAIGERDEDSETDDMYHQAMNAIFKENKPCHRLPQLRWSKRHPGKFRWVLYEMWPLTDPVTQRKAVLVCEQNISQVKALEEQSKKQTERLEAQLEEALAQRHPMHKPAIDIDTPADKTLKLLDKIMRGHEVTAREALELRDAILQAGDLRQPVNFKEQLVGNSQTALDNEVSQSLIQLLSSGRTPSDTGGGDGAGPSGYVSRGERASTRSSAVEEVAGSMDAVDRVITMTKNMPDALLSILSLVEEWQFNAFDLSEATQGRPLSVLAFVLFKRSSAFEKFQLDEKKLVNFLMHIEDGYPNNPYHNRIHATDVLQALHVLIVRGGLMHHGYCDEVALVSCYLSAIIHDFEHKGVNNDFLVRSSDELAILYNDRSPMENHHLAASFTLMNKSSFNFMSEVPHKTRENIRSLIIEMVLATDMKQHFSIHSMFQSKLQSGSRKSGEGSSGGIIHRPQDQDHRSLVLQVALKCADLGHLACPREVHRKWVHFLEEEFFMQGDREKRHNLMVSPLMDRVKNGISKSQVGFFDIVALPLFQSFAQAFNEVQPMLDSVKDNYSMWREEVAQFESSQNVAVVADAVAAALKQQPGQ